MSGFLRTLAMVFVWLLFIVLLLATTITLFGFGNELLDHYTGDGNFYQEQYPPINWWWLVAFVGGIVASTAVGYWMFAGDDDDGYYYCPNCPCEDCVQERRNRELAAATAVGVAVGTTIGLGS